MAKAAMMSVHPKWCGLIAERKKLLDVRKTRPKIPTPFKCYIYCTKDQGIQFWTGPRYSYADDHSHNQFDRCGNGKVIGEFVCDWIKQYDPVDFGTLEKESCVPEIMICEYMGESYGPYGWHISELTLYDTPRELNEYMKKPCDYAGSCGACNHAKFDSNYKMVDCELYLTHPPQSWCYVEEMT